MKSLASIVSPVSAAAAPPAPRASYKETTDAAASSSTKYTMAAGDSFTGSISVGDSDWVKISLTAGKAYEFDMSGTIGWAALELRGSDGFTVDLGQNDYANGDYESAAMKFVPQKSGTYYVRVGSHDNEWSGSYALKVKEIAPPKNFTYDQIAKQLTDGYWESVDFMSYAFDVKAGGTLTVNITALTTAGQQLAHWALDAWTAASGLKFKYVTGTAQIKFDDNQSGAFAGASSVMSDGTALSANVNVSAQWLADNGTTRDSYSMQTYVHEIGHALGLGHAGNYDGSAVWGVDNLYDNDSEQITVMSYFDVRYNPWSDGSYAYSITPMIADIIAIRNLYGTGAINSGNTVHNLKSYYGGKNPVAMTIVDTGGTDTLDMSWSTTAIKIDLNPEAFSSIDGGFRNLSIARGTIIENVIGGSGNDVLTGNSANNILDGRGGTDTLSGGAGNDTYVLGADSDKVSDSSGIDTITSTIARSLSGYTAIENLTLLGTGNINGTGNDLNNIIKGTSGKNTLTGGKGNDTLDGGAGADTLDGGAGNDIYVLGSESDKVTDASGTDTITSTITRSLTGYTTIENLMLLGTANINGTGNALKNVITGNAGNNILNGGTGVDSLSGGAGNDTYVLGAESDKVTDSAGIDTITSTITRSLTGYTTIENLTLLGTSKINGTGNALNNVITGNTASNILNGGAGNDKLSGGAGKDILTGGAGADSFLFNAALSASTNVDDITDFVVADDTILLENAIFTVFKAVGAISSASFIKGTDGLAKDSNDYLIYETDTGNLFYDSNGKTTGGSTLVAHLDANLALTYKDFLIV